MQQSATKHTTGLNGYTIRSGDTLFLAQYQPSGSKGGVILSFSDGSNSNWIAKDKEGFYLNDDQKQSTTQRQRPDRIHIFRWAGDRLIKATARDKNRKSKP